MSDDEEEKPKKSSKPVAEVRINDGMDVIQKRARDVDAFLAKSNGKDALLTAIADPPLGSKNDQAKDVRGIKGGVVWLLFAETNFILF